MRVLGSVYAVMCSAHFPHFSVNEIKAANHILYFLDGIVHFLWFSSVALGTLNQSLLWPHPNTNAPWSQWLWQCGKAQTILPGIWYDRAQTRSLSNKSPVILFDFKWQRPRPFAKVRTPEKPQWSPKSVWQIYGLPFTFSRWFCLANRVDSPLKGSALASLSGRSPGFETPH